MSLRHPIVLSLATLAVLTCTATAAASPLLDHSQVGVPHRGLTRAFSPGLVLTLPVPKGYERGCCYDSQSGQWVGPEFRASANSSVHNRSAIWFGVTYVHGRNLRKAALKAGWYGAPLVSRGKRSVRHVVALRKVGKLKGYAVLGVERSPGARVDGSLAVSLGHKVIAVVALHASDPPVDNAGGPGKLTVNGVAASTWNRKQVARELRRIYVQGNLPPRRISAKAKGRVIKGKIRDNFGDPLSELQITLRRGSHTVATSATNTKGAFSVTAPRAGRYRVVAKLAHASARSRVVRVH